MRPATRSALRHVLTHLLTPLLMCVGMGLAYLGAFAQPSPHGLPVAVVGSGARAGHLAAAIGEKAGDKLSVRTVADRDAAVRALEHRDVFGAYVPDRRAPELLVATAGSDTTASAVQKVFTPVAARQGAPLKVTDVVPPAGHDPTGQGIFFLLVALSIGSYASVAVIGGAGGALPLKVRAALAAAVSLVVSVIGTVLAGPVFHLVEHGLWGTWGLAWVYSAGVLFAGTGLHTFLKRWTTLGVMVLFVMLNFTSSGGVFRPELQNGFFRGLHGFWNGAGFVEGTRSLVYFDGYGLGGYVGTLVAWLAVGLVVLGAAWAVERRGHVKSARAAEAEEEMEEAVGV
ncbi:hypothetical protein I5Q34_10500 [Streptomyces sp. AV19]|uniref:hypothetical protein n=1 Tax=Streptomyces sp. AV19 TaxID=2793068 RepID=UPI0018FEBC42|nr:hypothetical protein [Streptomyces sp. AV19]MBH1934707.1 hypothetical protein [Streptomyces sp. AV19]MDG4530755.1 hypothetical protein [Streptomyces sp. AV19]